MIPLWNMHFLLQRYLNSHVYSGGDYEEIKTATFHPAFDNKRFKGYAKDVMVYIFVNCEELFLSPTL